MKEASTLRKVVLSSTFATGLVLAAPQMADADMRKPTAHYTFGVSNITGLTNVLTKQGELEDVVKQTRVDNLVLLPCGPIPPNPAELLNSRMMSLMLEHAQQQFDTIIIDTPPVMAVTDAQILASKCDGTVLVVSSGKTDRDEIRKAKELLNKANAKLLGAILNNKKMDSSSQYYYYGNE
ncbi:CpsD/CapB family tyrosine-protein kinase [Halalkalibacter akibai]|uniref:Tyrosine-protein kinase EpsD n=1 Tax=Halalkalibacter akibai (strain ATCC 43226 / DSM 21942 / CIP 109018 / JCM 9157 / 1139) TaxID=1236973 RepID=W4QSW4_HALA3|nr:CpsD/CapB family tyrosine-protein kinase [Halalkalibacter akibai]GAE34982.1 tyrosine-protein kinase EpsD [Halalkalibacter akibai JCM 9157]